MSTSPFAYKPVDPWRDFYQSQQKEPFHAYMRDYLAFLGACKTERECVRFFRDEAKKRGFLDLQAALAEPAAARKVPVPGTRYYRVNRSKALCLVVLGERPVTEGLRLIVTHVDSPRLDLKKRPLYQSSTLGYAKSHYYGAILKYQWVTVPLALHGKFVLKDGTPLDLVVGEDPNDPVFTITDIAPHLARRREARPLSEAIPGESLNVVMGNATDPADDGDHSVKTSLLNLFGEKHGIRERDFFSADIEMVPAMPPREVGLDRSMIGGYGQDDRSCSFAAFRALLEAPTPRYTSVVMMFDMEETGSEGPTGAKSVFTLNVVGDLGELTAVPGAAPSSNFLIRRVLARTLALSGDTSIAYDPQFAEQFDPLNSAKVGHGVLMKKYGGSHGKSGSMETSSEYMTGILQQLDTHGVRWQISEPGKVDEGAATTVAKFLGQYDMDIIDCGTPVMSLHSPFELCSKIDLWNTYRAYQVFFAERMYNNYERES